MFWGIDACRKCDIFLSNGEIVQLNWTIGDEFSMEWENRNGVGYITEGFECQGEEYLFMQGSNVIKSVLQKY